MNTKHTPAPWEAGNTGFGKMQIWSSNEGKPYGDFHLIATVNTVDSKEGNQLKANAKLIAAAPELLEALDFLLKAAIHCDPFFETRWNIAADKAKAAIKKATE